MICKGEQHLNVQPNARSNSKMPPRKLIEGCACKPCIKIPKKTQGIYLTFNKLHIPCLNGWNSEFPFDALDSAGKALQMVCEQLEATEKPSTWTRMGFQRNSARTTANGTMMSLAARDFTDLRRAIQGFETKWKSDQSQASVGPSHARVDADWFFRSAVVLATCVIS